MVYIQIELTTGWKHHVFLQCTEQAQDETAEPQTGVRCLLTTDINKLLCK